MRPRSARRALAAQMLLLLLPATLFTAFTVGVGLPTYPHRGLRAPQRAFDLALLVALAGSVATWRLALVYLRAGPPGVVDAHRAWLVLAASGALVGLGGAAAATIHALDLREPDASVGFGLLAPAAALTPPVVQLLHARRRSA